MQSEITRRGLMKTAALLPLAGAGDGGEPGAHCRADRFGWPRQTFIRNIQNGTPEHTGVRSAESTLTAIMGRMAIDQKREITWEEVIRS